MEKVLIIGSNSFSGSDFIDLLLEKGSYEVVGISRSKQKKALFLPYKRRKQDHFTFYQIDLNKDLEKLSELLKHFNLNMLLILLHKARWHRVGIIPTTGFKPMLFL